MLDEQLYALVCLPTAETEVGRNQRKLLAYLVCLQTKKHVTEHNYFEENKRVENV